jgi:ATP adenylyltransferase
MPYKELEDFIQNKMRMSHIYQPVMLMILLKNNGNCHEQLIARALLERDLSQIEYYTAITNNMVGRVLQNHKF